MSDNSRMHKPKKHNITGVAKRKSAQSVTWSHQPCLNPGTFFANRAFSYGRCTHFTCFTGTKVQILTPEKRVGYLCAFFALWKCPECPNLCIRSGEKFIALENMSIHRPCLLRAIDELKSDLRKVRCELENKPSGDWVNTGLGLRWVKVEPNACTREIQSVPLSAALKNKADFTKSELNAFFLGNLYHDSYIKVGNTSFKPIEGPIPFPKFQLTDEDLPVSVHESTPFENTILDTSAHVYNSISFRF